MSTTGLLNRLKAKLSSQQFSTKEIASLAERENDKKQKAINESICDAVSAAVKSEDFTKAVAEHLASELKPSLSTLDSSSYYTKLQLSTDKLSELFQAQDIKLTQLSTILEASNSSTAEKLINIEASINNIKRVQEESEKKHKITEEQQRSNLEHVIAEIATLQEKLIAINTSLFDQIESAKTNIVAATTTPFPDLIKSLDTVLKTLEQNSAKLDEVKAKEFSSEVLTSIQDLNKLQTQNIVDLGRLKLSTETSLNNTVKLRTDSENISSSLAATHDQIKNVNSLLLDIKSSDVNAEILAETKASNESHFKSTILLEEIKSNQTEILPTISASNLSNESNTKALFDLKQSEQVILDNLKSVHTTISDQSQILLDTKISLTKDIATVAELANTSESIELLKKNSDSLAASLIEVKSAIENVKPVSQNVDLTELESSIQSVVTAIGQIKNINESLSEKLDLTPIISGLETQSNQISEVKSSLIAVTSDSNKPDLSTIDSSLKDLSLKLETQLAVLTELKAALKSPEESQPIDSSTS